MKKSGVQAQAAQFDRGKYIEFIVRIPKEPGSGSSAVSGSFGGDKNTIHRDIETRRRFKNSGGKRALFLRRRMNAAYSRLM